MLQSESPFNIHALELKEKAVKKFSEEDYGEAKKLAQEAQAVFPWINICSFIAIIGIYLSRKRIIDGEPDWYGVLGLDNTATLEKIHEKYFKLYEEVMGSENDVVGREGALHILAEAFCKLTEDQFWTMCPKCQFKFHYSNDIINKEIVCSNCDKCYLAVPLSFGTQPTSPRFDKRRRSVVLALRAPSSGYAGGSGSSKRK